MSTPEQVKELYNKPIFIRQWKGYDVYCEDYGEEAPAIGLPQFALYKDGKARLTTEEEAFAFIKDSPSED